VDIEFLIFIETMNNEESQSGELEKGDDAPCEPWAKLSMVNPSTIAVLALIGIVLVPITVVETGADITIGGIVFSQTTVMAVISGALMVYAGLRVGSELLGPSAYILIIIMAATGGVSAMALIIPILILCFCYFYLWAAECREMYEQEH